MKNARTAAVLTWVNSAAFGIPAVPVSAYLLRNGNLPWFLDLFPMYGGPWSSSLDVGMMVALLMTFLIVNVFAAWAAWLVWKGSKFGAALGLLLLPVEAVFWFGFALPIPWLIGAARAVFLAGAFLSGGSAKSR